MLIYYLRLYLFLKFGFKSHTLLPEDISIELTNRCNFQCSYCIHSDASFRKKVEYKSLSLPELKVILKKIRSSNIKTKVIHFTLGGEPFLFNEINKAFELAYQFGFRKIIFSSNGVLLTKDIYDQIFYKNDLFYNIWIDYCNDEHYFEQVRGFSGSWLKIKTNLENIIKNDSNKNIKINLTDISNYKNKDKEYVKNEFKKLKALFNNNSKLKFHQRTFHNATGFLDINKNKSKNQKICPHPWASLVIASNGNIVACSRDITHKTVLGNILDSDLKDIFQSKKYQEFRLYHKKKDLQKFDACRNCDLPYDKSKMNLKHYIYVFINRLGGI